MPNTPKGINALLTYRKNCLRSSSTNEWKRKEICPKGTMPHNVEYHVYVCVNVVYGIYFFSFMKTVRHQPVSGNVWLCDFLKSSVNAWLKLKAIASFCEIEPKCVFTYRWERFSSLFPCCRGCSPSISLACLHSYAPHQHTYFVVWFDWMECTPLTVAISIMDHGKFKMPEWPIAADISHRWHAKQMNCKIDPSLSIH